MKSRLFNYHSIRGIAAYLILIVLASSCGQTDKTQISNNIPARKVSVPAFNADSAYFFVEEQVNFGPRIPNTRAHNAAGDQIIKRLEAYGAKLTIQSFKATTYDGVTLSLRNIMGSFNPDAKKRILLAAHWDTRPWASKEKEDPTVQFDGANDGASGVGVLLGIARTIQSSTPPDVGIDLLFFDGEDWGQEGGGSADTWCLGSQYWAKNKGKYAAYYGVLLDMVGGKNAQFPYEAISRKNAKKILTKVWTHASDIGYSRYFIPRKEGSITDDHYYVNKIAKIPMIDIIHWEQGYGYFGDWHHTRKDNMDIIDKNTLKAVGQTVLRVVYYEEL